MGLQLSPVVATEGGATLTEAEADLLYLRLDGGNVMTGNIDVGANDILHVDSIFGSTAILPVRIGDAATTSQSLASEDDLLVTGKLEVDGVAYLDGSVVSGTSFRSSDNIRTYWGSDNNSGMMYSTAQTPDSLVLGVSVDSNGFIISETGDVAYDFAHPQQTNPTLFIQSANQSATEWLSLTHDQTDGRIQTGAGNLSIGSGSASQALTTSNDLFVSGKLEVDGFLFADSFLFVENDIRLNGGGKLTTNANGTITLLPDGSGITVVGDAGSTSHALNTGDDFFVNGRLEVDGMAYFDGSITLLQNQQLVDSNTAGGIYLSSVAQTPNAPMLLTGVVANLWILSEYADRTYDFAHAQQTNPTLFIQSANQSLTEWISLSHIQTSGLLEVGAGDLTITCPTDKTLTLSETVWEDMRIPGLSVALGASAPDLVAFLAAGDLKTYAFDGNATTEEVHFTVQLSHGYKEGTDIDAHVHWSPTTAGAGNVKWNLEYTWVNIDGTFGASTTISGIDATDTTAWKHLLIDLGTITGTSKAISSMLVCRLFRDPADGSDTYGDDAALLEIDFHYQIDTIGSRQELVK